VLKDGVRYQGEGGRADYQVVNFKRLKQRIEEAPISTKVSIEARSTSELMGRQDGAASAELHWRLALPLLVLITALMGTGVARTKPREGRFAQVVPGLGLFLAYYAALVLNKDVIADGVWPAGLGMWVVHGLFLGIGLMLIRHAALPARV
jgi:lipopolysaccharide export system permease protein